MSRRTPYEIALCVFATAVVPAWAIKTATWRHSQPKDFSEGTFEQTVVTSHGEVMLGREAKVLHAAKGEADMVNALARGGDGALYAATGGDGVIYRIADDQAKVFARLPEKNVFSLVFAKDGALLAGTGGERGRIHRIDREGGHRVFFEPEDVKYVWAMVRGADGTIYAATGTDGRIYRIEPTGKDGKVLVQTKQKNILCLIVDDAGMLYAGTDTEGLVYRIDPKDGKAYVLYDAEEPEISSLTIDNAQNVYAATAAAAAARPGQDTGEKPGGKPELPAPTAPATKPATRPAGDSAKPTAEMLLQARAARPSAAAPSSMMEKAAAALAQAMGGKPPTASGPAAGNAIYRIDRDGFVTEVFREPVMILAVTEADGKLYAATGNEGRVYEIAPADELTTCIARLKATQALSLLRLEDGTLVVGTANEGSIVRIGRDYARKGTYVSPALDARQIVRFGRIRWEARVPEGTRLTVATRSGNVKDADHAPWDAWSEEADADAGTQVASPCARFLQYRLTFETTKEGVTPVLHQIDIPRLEDNRPPRIPALKVGPARRFAQDPSMAQLRAKLMGSGAGEGRSEVFAIVWSAEDPNGDAMIYNVYYRNVGQQRWVELEKDSKETLKLWDTRTVSDGRYEVKILASDSPDNPVGTALTYRRISDPVLVDNTPPAILVEKLSPDGKKLHVRALIKDAMSNVVAAKYAINSNDEWKALASADDIFDSPEEAVEFTVEDLGPGEHRLVIQAEDESGNTAYATRAVILGP